MTICLDAGQTASWDISSDYAGLQVPNINHKSVAEHILKAIVLHADLINKRLRSTCQVEIAKMSFI